MAKAWLSLITCLIAWPAMGRAMPFAESETLLKAYRFVSSKMPDPVRRASCPLDVEFVRLQHLNLVGATPFRPAERGCPDLIQIDQSLSRDWKAGLVMAHELVHVFRQTRTTKETAWLEEGLAKLVEHQYLGIGPITLADQLLEIDEFVLDTDWNHYVGESPSYAMAYFFALYLYNRLGEDEFLREWIASPLTGWDAIEAAARNVRAKRRINLDEKWLSRDSIWTHFAFALLLNDPSLADHNLFALDSRYKALATLPSKLFRVSFQTQPRAPGERLRFYRWPAVTAEIAKLALGRGTSASIQQASNANGDLPEAPFALNAAWYVVKLAPSFEVKAFDQFSELAKFARASRGGFDYLIEVRFSPRGE